MLFLLLAPVSGKIDGTTTLIRVTSTLIYVIFKISSCKCEIEW